MKDRRRWFLIGLITFALIAAADLYINGFGFTKPFGRGFSAVVGPTVRIR